MADILLPVGRMIGGSLYTPQLVVDENTKHPVMDQKTGEQRKNYNIGYAIPKTGEQHWSQTPWGAQIKAVGDAAYPGMSANPVFAWKIIDGDSQIPNKNNRRPCDQEGFVGHWILWFSQGWAPTLVDAHGNTSPGLLIDGAVMPGDWIQVYAGVAGNTARAGRSHTPGIYLNPQAIAFVGYHEKGRISISSVDTKAVGFGTMPLPAGVVSTPPAAMSAPVAPVAPVAPAPVAQPPAAPVPNPAILSVPVPPPALPAKQMTAAAGGATYEQMLDVGWTDETLVAAGMMAA